MKLKWLPNAITLARCGLAVGVGGVILSVRPSSFLPFIMFVAVAATDFIDGWMARRLKAVSAFGTFLDPIADKLLVGISLLALTSLQNWTLILLIPTAAIIIRDLIATGLRLVPSIDMPVSKLAKWKTAVEMLGISALLIAAPFASNLIANLGLALVWLSAILSIYTLGLYLGTILADGKRPHP